MASGIGRGRRLVATIAAGAAFIALADVGVVVAREGARGTAISPAQALSHYRAQHQGTPSPSAPAAGPTVSADPGPSATGATPGGPATGSLGATVHRSSAPPAGGSGSGATSSHGPPAPPGGSLPAPGVYVYDTSGYEQVAVPGSRRDFPAQTTITVDQGDCGVVEAWKPFDQHTEKTVVCASARGLQLASYFVSVSFYGQNDTTTVTCGPDAYLYLDGAMPGQSWTFVCSSQQTTAQNRVTFVGLETLAVQGTPVRTEHVHIDTTTTGSSGGGSSPADYWFSTNDATLIRNTGSVHGNGSAQYDEHYDLELTSLEPQT